ncbi:MAG: DUF3990 domain-containing protein [Bifidobacteriaceae bacterium]|nr:DUF3990 domain-containing protein [Bifidobacteriaceae bacterium]
MILYHGSNQVVRGGDLSRCRPFKDFGRGFYLSENPAHACPGRGPRLRCLVAGALSAPPSP